MARVNIERESIMGNRAVMTIKGSSVGVYVHWNGGRASVEGFLQACKRLGYRGPEQDKTYSMAGLVHVINTFMNYDGLSVGVGELGILDCDNWDNGLYIIGGDWEIVERQYKRQGDEVDAEKTQQIADSIVEKLTPKPELNLKDLDQYVTIHWNSVDGYVYGGPFKSQEDAAAAAEREAVEWWVVKLEQPKDLV